MAAVIPLCACGLIDTLQANNIADEGYKASLNGDYRESARLYTKAAQIEDDPGARSDWESRAADALRKAGDEQEADRLDKRAANLKVQSEINDAVNADMARSSPISRVKNGSSTNSSGQCRSREIGCVTNECMRLPTCP